jgi:hypothetical protein
MSARGCQGMRRPKSCVTESRVRPGASRRGDIARGCAERSESDGTKRLMYRDVVELAEGLTATDLLIEYRHLSWGLAVDPGKPDTAHLATLCAIAIARALILERRITAG